MEEKIIVENDKTTRPSLRSDYSLSDNYEAASKINDVVLPNYIRSETGMGELDRVLGGGIVSGSVILLTGEPGIGKSTLLLQISDSLCRDRCALYISGEESRGQLKLRARRLKVEGDNLYIFTNSNVDDILSEVERISPQIVIVDSIQTIYSDKLPSSPGSVAQIKETAAQFISMAKSKGISVILVGHVNKEGSIAGPKILEHMVDAVLCFEGERENTYRVIRAVKNRYGSTNEIGVFEMTSDGLVDVPNPSAALLEGRPKNIPGSCAVCVMEGTRPIIAEVQALVSPTGFSVPRRTSNGLDYNRVYLLLAVLERRLGIKFSSYDVYLNVVGGLRLADPATDLAVCLALISCVRDIPFDDKTIVVGEIGLAGECRSVVDVEKRMSEAARLGFSKIILPKRCLSKANVPAGIEALPVSSIYDVIKYIPSQIKNGE